MSFQSLRSPTTSLISVRECALVPSPQLKSNTTSFAFTSNVVIEQRLSPQSTPECFQMTKTVYLKNMRFTSSPNDLQQYPKEEEAERQSLNLKRINQQINGSQLQLEQFKQFRQDYSFHKEAEADSQQGQQAQLNQNEVQRAFSVICLQSDESNKQIDKLGEFCFQVRDRRDTALQGDSPQKGKESWATEGRLEDQTASNASGVQTEWSNKQSYDSEKTKRSLLTEKIEKAKLDDRKSGIQNRGQTTSSVYGSASKIIPKTWVCSRISPLRDLQLNISSMDKACLPNRPQIKVPRREIGCAKCQIY